jgi:hypothetical protein
MGEKVIKDYHPELDGIRVDFVLRDTTIMAGKKEIWGRAKKVTGLTAFLADSDETGDEFFLIEISQGIWDKLNEAERTALIDHELCHCVAERAGEDPTSPATLKLRTHDFEEFHEIIKRHGLWRPDMEAAAATFDEVLET